MNGWEDAIVGGWQVSGLYRWSSGLPFTIGSGLGFWPTNWELTSSAVMNGAKPSTGKFTDSDGDPNVFKDFTNAINSFRFAFPGESGQRNELRGPGIFDIDLGVAKAWKITESQSLRFSWETFNLTNSVRFDAASGNGSLANNTSFGKFIKTLSTPRVMQFSLRYNF
jgi:hypothetical protein